MKILLLIPGLLLTASLQAQEQQTAVAERTPPVITEAKVEQDTQMALELRKKAKDNKKPVNKEAKPKKEEDQRLSATNTISSAKTTSKKPGEQ